MNTGDAAAAQPVTVSLWLENPEDTQEEEHIRLFRTLNI
jgi:hypothetical protein